MKKTTLPLSLILAAAFIAPAQAASYSTAAQAKQAQAEHVAKKGGSKKPKAPKKGQA